MSTFPIAPINGEIATVANVAYQYSSSTNAWRRVIGNISTLSVAGNTSTGNLLTGGYVTATGNITGSYIIGNGSQLTGLPAGYANSNAVAYGQSGWGGNIIPSSNAVYSLGTAALQWKSLYVSNTTVYIGDVPLSTEGNVLTVAGNTVLTATNGNFYISGMISATGNIQGNYILGNGSQLSGLPATYSNANVAAYLPTYTGNLTAGNISATGNITGAYIIGNGSQLTGLPAGYANSNAASYFASGNVTTDILTTANVSATGNITGGNITTTGSSGNISGANYITANVFSATGNITGNYFVGNGAALSDVAGANVTGTVANATYAISSGTATSATTAGTVTTAAQPNITSVGTLTSVTVTGNATGGNLLTGGLISATGNVQGNYILGNGSQLTGLPEQYGNANVAAYLPTYTGNLTAGNISASGNTISGNVLTGGIVSATSNITGSNLLTGGAVSATGNATAGNVLTAGLISAGSNITGANIVTAGLITATGNISTAGIINTANIYGSAGETISTGANANINLYPGGTGNIVLPSGNATYINNLASPVQNSDAATKQYVDNAVSTQLSYHQAVTAATTANLATTTGGTVTYAQPNGAGNGIGATLTTTGSFNLIDTANVQTVGTRILVKNEGNAVFNGIYSWSNATVIVRTTDADEYGPNSAEQLSINDYFFVTSGNVNAGSAWIVDSPAGTITFGTSNIAFAQFSSSQTYSAGNGISFAGTVVNAQVDGVTTAFDGGGNISVKASANLTTPNIGAATGTSVNVSANVTGGNVLTAGIMSSTGNAIHGNISTAGLITAAGNVTGGNVLTAGIMSSTGNAIHGNILTAGLISATSTITSAANVTGGNITTTGLITVTGNATAGNIATAGLVTATGNLQAGNIRTAGLFSATGNVTGNYFIGNGSALTGITLSGAMTWVTQANTAPSNVAAGSYWYDSYSGVKYQYTNDGTGNVWVDQSFPTSFTTLAVTGNATIGGNLGVTGTLTYGNISTTGNVDGGNLRTSGVVTATGNVTGGNILTAGLMSSTGNAIHGNILTAGLISATGNATAGNISATNHTGTTVSVTGNVTGASLVGTIATAAQPTITSVGTLTALTVSNATVSSWVTSVTGGILGSVTGNQVLLGRWNTNDGNQNYLELTETRTSNGATWLTAATRLQEKIDASWMGFMQFNGTNTNAGITFGTGSSTANATAVPDRLYIDSSGNMFPAANISYNLGATGNYWNNFYAANVIATTVSTTGNISGGNLNVSGNIVDAGDLIITSSAANANITLTPTGTGTIIVSKNITNGQANGVGNIGSATSYFNTIFAKATSAQYADLAEMYCADEAYEPGTVIEFGGVDEVTITTNSHSPAVAGIVSTNPSYLMNATLDCVNAVQVALTGRVPCRVIGIIRKGDRLVASDLAGVATVLDMNKYEPGCIIGKALENYNDNSVGVIEVAVGRT